MAYTVAIVLTKEMSNYLQGYHLINQEIMMIKFKTKNDLLFVYQIYTPESTYSNDDKKTSVTLQQELNNMQEKANWY